MQFLVGVDEAGRAPLAGPVSVGVVIVPKHFSVKKAFPLVNDSKQVSEQVREDIFEALRQRAALGEVQYAVRYSSHEYIDRFGITKAVRRAVWSGVRRLAPEPERTEILLDGLLCAPLEYKNQKTIIHGDEIEPLISLASIVAKVSRDRLMKKIAVQYPEYAFETHKGYPTRAHYEALRANGLCTIHRRTYCRNIILEL